MTDTRVGLDTTSDNVGIKLTDSPSGHVVALQVSNDYMEILGWSLTSDQLRKLGQHIDSWRARHVSD